MRRNIIVFTIAVILVSSYLVYSSLSPVYKVYAEGDVSGSTENLELTMRAEVVRKKGSHDKVKFVFGLKNIGEKVYNEFSPDLFPFDVIVYSEDGTFLSYVHSMSPPVDASLFFKLKPGQSYNTSMHPYQSPETKLWGLKLWFPKRELKDWKKWFVKVREGKQIIYHILKPGKYILKGVWLLEGWDPGGWDRGAEVMTSPLTMEIKQRYVLHWPNQKIDEVPMG